MPFWHHSIERSFRPSPSLSALAVEGEEYHAKWLIEMAEHIANAHSWYKHFKNGPYVYYVMPYDLDKLREGWDLYEPDDATRSNPDAIGAIVLDNPVAVDSTLSDHKRNASQKRNIARAIDRVYTALAAIPTTEPQW